MKSVFALKLYQHLRIIENLGQGWKAKKSKSDVVPTGTTLRFEQGKL